MSLSYSEVGEILKMIESSSCTEVVLELEGIKLVVRKGAVKQDSQYFPALITGEVPLPATDGLGGEVTKSNPSVEKKTLVSSTDENIVRSPMVGTFYSRSSPDAKPFVTVGQTIKKGETVCLVEVMKLFTAVECPRDCKISSIFVEDGELVEYDQILFAVK